MGSTGELPGIGWDSLTLTFGALAVVCIVAWVALRAIGKRLGTGATSGPLRVLARCPLEPRRSVVIVQAQNRCFLLGVGDGPTALLAELDAAGLGQGEAASMPRAKGFADVLKRVLGTPRASRPEEPDRAPSVPERLP